VILVNLVPTALLVLWVHLVNLVFLEEMVLMVKKVTKEDKASVSDEVKQELLVFPELKVRKVSLAEDFLVNKVLEENKVLKVNKVCKVMSVNLVSKI